MLIFDLRKPMLEACEVHDTDKHPLEALINLADRSIGMMMLYNVDAVRLSYSFLSFDPGTGKHITVEAPDPVRAYELAQAEYQRDTEPSQLAQ
ncbi:hypothetical protein [Vreelandella maris]|uniref:Uncharacterized protein n=1 Tax=Vreelandella maris TaxID=2729617 RepID=A0A7Y6RBB5_9GAMM|nr:hypothetical protein [Halomonas maris]NVF13773.1 hypothetical protein [Halomonas maris]|tara:strand:- start:1740 stop:2018 length:279 start_codon:yes stop_codon:yes gene_type:complete